MKGTLPPPDDTAIGGFDEAGGHRLWILTGPNMAGKSTFLRQNALIAILAQIGSFVPARSAHIGIVDRLFSRVGASDDLARGRSTFMVEMVETAGILNQATPRSLVILDEIGRGTATFDGLSIAWASLEYLNAVNQCRALFATHFHELTALAGTLSGVANATMEVKEWQDGIVFMHRVVPGAASRSYGIQVAKLAGLPRPVIERASEVLKLLEADDSRRDAKDLAADLPLFAAARPKSAQVAAAATLASGPTPVEEALAQVAPDDLTPRQALEKLFELKALLKRTPPR
jgi:DNA mismatch repair protein MutS